MPKQTIPVEQCLRLFAGFPVVLVSTRANLLLVGMAHYFCFQPLTLGVGIAKERYSHALIRREGEFVVNLLTPELLDAARICGRRSGRDCDKFAAARLTPQPGKEIQASLVAECPVSIECRITQELDLGERTWFLGEVLCVHCAPEYDPGRMLLCGREWYRVAGEIVGLR